MVTVNTQSFVSALKRALGSTTDRSTVQILSHFSIIASRVNDTVTIIGTDTEQTYVETLHNVDVHTSFDVTVPAKMALKLLSKAKSERITISTGLKYHVTIEFVGTKRKGTLYGTSGESFPMVNQGNLKGDVIFKATFDAVNIAKSLANLVPFVSTDALRFYLQGIGVSCAENGIELAATDSRRMGYINVNCDVDTQLADDTTIIVPARFAKELLLTLEHKKTTRKGRVNHSAMDSRVEISATADRVVAIVGDRRLESSLIDGRFPDYRGVIPHETKIVGNFWADRSELLDVIGYVSQALDKDTPQIRCSIADEQLTIRTHCSPRGIMSDTVTLVSTNSVAAIADFGVNYKFLQDAITLLTDDEYLTIKLTDSPVDPIQLNSGDLNCVVMPMRLEAVVADIPEAQAESYTVPREFSPEQLAREIGLLKTDLEIKYLDAKSKIESKRLESFDKCYKSAIEIAEMCQTRDEIAEQLQDFDAAIDLYMRADAIHIKPSVITYDLAS